MSDKQQFKLGILAWWLPLLAGVLITLITAQAFHHQNEMDLKAYANTLADKTEDLIQKRFQAFEDGLRATSGAIVAAGVEDLSQQQFENYINSRNVKQEYPGAMLH